MDEEIKEKTTEEIVEELIAPLRAENEALKKRMEEREAVIKALMRSPQPQKTEADERNEHLAEIVRIVNNKRGKK